MSAEDRDDADARKRPELEEVAENEHQYLHERLRQELGREPTEQELNEWLRQHTEGY
jgi:DNA-directed RNA polymerase specialized sigma subunit